MTAYGLGHYLDSILKGSVIEDIREYPSLLSFSLAGDSIGFMNIFRAGARSAIILGSPPPSSRDNSIPIFKQAWGAEITAVEPLGIDRLILIRTGGGEQGWENLAPYIFRLDFITPSAPVSLFNAETGDPVAISGSARIGDAAEAKGRPESAEYSLLSLPAEPPDSLEEALENPAGRLPRLIEGLDPASAELIAADCGGAPGKLWSRLAETGSNLKEPGNRWVLYRRGKGTAIYPVRLPAGASPVMEGEYAEVMELHFRETVRPEYMRTLRRMAGAKVRARRKKLRKLIRNLEGDSREAGRHEEYLSYGNLLTSHFRLISKGLSSIELPSHTGDEKITIPLRPELSPQGNIKRYFKKARKGKRGMKRIEKRIREAEKELVEIETLLGRIEEADGPEPLYRYIERKKGPETGPAREASSEFRKYTIEGKYTVYVGRNAKENDRLTHAFASGDDLWFHARGVPGSHVLLRGANRSTPPRILKKVAAIAAYYSKSRNSELVPVSYTEKRYVRKPRKSPPGTARIDRESTLFVNPSVPDENSAG